MKRFTKQIVMVIVVLSLLVPSIIWAQEEGVTLESLAEQLSSLVQRVEALESIWEGPGSISLEDGGCMIATGALQRETAIKFYDTFEEFPEYVSIYRVAFQPEENKVLILYTEGYGDDRWVYEMWTGCEFEGSSEWEEDE